MKKIASILSALMMSSIMFAGTNTNLMPKGFHDCEHAAYGQAELFVYTENNHNNSHNSFTLIPNNTALQIGYVPFSVAGYKDRIDFSKKQHVFEITHTGFYKISYFFTCYGPDQCSISDSLNIGVRITNKKNQEKKIFAFHKLFPFALASREKFSIADQCLCRLAKGDKVGLYIFKLPEGDLTPPTLTYNNEGKPPVIPDTAASLSIFKAETD